jgi:hypothetical protein
MRVRPNVAGESSGGRKSSSVCHASIRLDLWTTLRRQIVCVVFASLINPHSLLEQNCLDVPSSHQSDP